MQGYGKMEWLDGRIYQGQFHQDKRHGYGEYTLADGSCYKGEFIDNQLHGQGTYIQGGLERHAIWRNGSVIT